MPHGSHVSLPAKPDTPNPVHGEVTVDYYNNSIGFIKDQHESLVKQLNIIGDDEDLHKRLATLFQNNPRLALCLVHRHVELRTGERIISVDVNATNPKGRDRDHSPPITISEPSSDSSNFKAERWLVDKTDRFLSFEFTRNTENAIAPSHDFVEEFRSILQRYGLTSLLGVCLRPPLDKLRDDELFIELWYPVLKEMENNRRQGTYIRTKTFIGKRHAYGAVWVPYERKSRDSTEREVFIGRFEVCIVCSNTDPGCQGTNRDGNQQKGEEPFCYYGQEPPKECPGEE